VRAWGARLRLQCDRHSTRVDFSPTSLAPKGKSRLREDRRPPLLSPPIYSPRHLLTTFGAPVRALQHRPPPCRNSAGHFTHFAAAQPSQRALDVSRASVVALSKNHFHVPAHLRARPFRNLPRHLSSTRHTEKQHKHPQNTAHRRRTRCRGETAA
jgi:hypothetical protein